MLAMAILPMSFLSSPGGASVLRPLEVASPPYRVARPRMQAGSGVPLTGQTLEASLKIRCDATDSAYAIYWSRVGDIIKPTGFHVANPKAAGFVAASQKIELNANDNSSPMTAVKMTGEPEFMPNVVTSDLKRKELAFQNGISQLVLMPFEDGVIEFGNARTSKQWDAIPSAPTVPKAPLRRAFEDLGALYAIVWSEDAEGTLRVVGDYENPRDKARRVSLRGDGQSFTGLSREITLDPDGEGPAGQALREGKEKVVVFGEGEDQGLCASMKRASAAREFGVCEVHFLPFEDPATGTRNVLEFGVSTLTELNRATIDSTLSLQTQIAGASYAIYWAHEGAYAVQRASHVTDTYRAELKALDKTITFPEASQAITYDLEGSTPIAQVMRERQPMVVLDMSACLLDTERAQVAEAYLVESVAFVPVLGGVIEFGTTVARGKWEGPEEALAQIVPNEEIDKAFREGGATYGIFWRRNDATGKYEQAAAYERPTNALSKEQQAKGKSYLTMCKDVRIDMFGKGPVALCGSSSSIVHVANTETFHNFNRRELAKEWGVGKFTCVPLETGVLEYGTVTKDKRETTQGSEYQEAVRQYRRTVFMHDDWEKHRSTDRFFKSLMTIGESGVIRARGKELSIGAGISSFLVAWNTLAAGYTDFDLVKHPALIPHLPTLFMPFSIFSLTSGSLGLLLVFQTNAAYARWDDARKVWGSIINNCRSLVRQGNTFFLEDRYPGYGNFRDHRRRLAAQTSAFTRCLRCFLRGKADEPNLEFELKSLGFTKQEVAGYMGATNRQVYALQKMAETARVYKMDPRDRVRMDQTLSVLMDNVGACERIFKSPIPLTYTRHTSRFVGVWLALLPLAMWANDPSWNHLASIPSNFVIAFFLLGVEELGMQIEEPFGILPMEAFCDGSIGAVLNEMVISEDKKRATEVELRANLVAAAECAIDSNPA
jgi:putative membrane protein